MSQAAAWEPSLKWTVVEPGSSWKAKLLDGKELQVSKRPDGRYTLRFSDEDKEHELVYREDNNHFLVEAERLTLLASDAVEEPPAGGERH